MPRFFEKNRFYYVILCGSRSTLRFGWRRAEVTPDLVRPVSEKNFSM